MSLNKVAVIATRGGLNDFIQMTTLLMASTVANAAVRVLFRDAAVLGVTVRGARRLSLPPALKSRSATVRAFLQQQGLADLSTMLQTVRGHGDVRLWACSSSMALYGVMPEELLPELDGVQGLTAFVINEVGSADQVFAL